MALHQATEPRSLFCRHHRRGHEVSPISSRTSALHRGWYNPAAAARREVSRSLSGKRTLSSALDDVIDLMNHAARSFSLFDVNEPTPAMRAQMALLIPTTTCLEQTLPLLGKSKFEDLRDRARAIKDLEKEGDSAFRTAIAELFRDETLDAKHLLRQKELLELLEGAIDGCEDVAELLAHLAVKHG